MRNAIDHGVNFYDSSPMYGSAERVLGIALGSSRPRVSVATKVWTSSEADGRRQIGEALTFYGGFVDLYQVHNLVAWRTHLPVLHALRDEGRIGAVGITDFRHSSFGEIARLMETEDIQTIQIPYNAANRDAERELLPLASARDIGVITMSPLGTGRLISPEPPLDELRRFHDFGVRTWAQVLLKWIVSDSRVGVTIPATSKPERARENAQAGQPPFFGQEERERVAWLAGRRA